MVDVSTERFEPLADRSATLLLVAGALWTVELLAMVVRQFTAAAVPNAVLVLTVLPAMLCILLAVMGFYPAQAEELPRLATAAVALAVLALVAFAVNLVWLLGTILLGAPNPHILVLVGALLVTVLSVLLFAGGGVRAGTPSRTVGLLLVGFMVVWLVWLANFFAGIIPDGPAIVMHVLFAALVLGAGYAHRTGATPLASDEGTVDATA